MMQPRIAACGALVLLLAAAPPALAQDPASPPQEKHPLSASDYTPITTGERTKWFSDGTLSAKSLGIGVWSATWQQVFDWPEEWDQGWSGWGKRFAEREVDVTLSNALEAGVGALWGEDPRYIPSGKHGVGARIGYALKTAFVAPRRDGHLAPAWGRYVGNTVNNLIENTWLPPSVTTPGQTALRCADGLLSRMAGNLFEEFWPEVRKRMGNRVK